MENKFNVLLVQNNAKLADKEANFSKIESLLAPYKDKGIDLIVLPELFSIGWDTEVFRDVAEVGDDNDTVKFLSNIARNFNSYLAGGSYVRKISDEDYRNSSPFFDRYGRLITHYDKMHLFGYFGYHEDIAVSNGESGVIIDTDMGKIGLSICYDLRFAELFKSYADKGAEILINMAAWPKSRLNHWVTLQKARAIENQAYVLAISQTGLLSDGSLNLGHSMVVEPYGDVVATLGEEEACLLVQIDMQKLRDLRKDFPILTDRHENYSIKVF